MFPQGKGVRDLLTEVPIDLFIFVNVLDVLKILRFLNVLRENLRRINLQCIFSLQDLNLLDKLVKRLVRVVLQQIFDNYFLHRRRDCDRFRRVRGRSAE